MEGQQLNSLKILKMSSAYNCKSCSHDVFDLSSRLRTISGMVLGRGTGLQTMPIEVWVCRKCGTVAEELIPEEVRNALSTEKKEEVKKSSIILG